MDTYKVEIVSITVGFSKNYEKLQKKIEETLNKRTNEGFELVNIEINLEKFSAAIVFKR